MIEFLDAEFEVKSIVDFGSELINALFVNRLRLVKAEIVRFVF